MMRVEGCGWPFACTPGCAECAGWEQAYGDSIEHWLEAKQDAREAMKRGKRG